MMALSGPKILVVEDEEGIRQMLGYLLMREGYRLTEAVDANQTLRELKRDLPDLILVDWMLPGMSGIDLLRVLKSRAATRDIPVIMLTVRAEEDDRIQGLESGADDYVIKPFSNRELLARIKRVLTRAHTAQAQDAAATSLRVMGLELDLASMRVTADGRELHLSLTEFRLLQAFMENPDRLLTRDILLDQVWGVNSYVGERTIDVYVRRLRQALRPVGMDELIHTLRGAGYRFTPNPIGGTEE